MHIKAKKRDTKERKLRRVTKRKGIEAQRVKPRVPTRAISALIGDEKQKRRNRERNPIPLPWKGLILISYYP